jgi:hypothetical protein
MNKKSIIFILLLFIAAVLSFFSEEPFNEDLFILSFYNFFIFSFLVIMNESLLFSNGIISFNDQLKEFYGILKWKNKYIKFLVLLTPFCLSLPCLFKKNLIEFTIVFSLLFMQNIITFLVLSRFDLKTNKTLISNLLMLILVLFIIANKYDVFILKFIIYFISATTSFYYFITDSVININTAIIFGFTILFVVIVLLYFIDKFIIKKRNLL